jgi:hypothetical protein
MGDSVEAEVWVSRRRLSKEAGEDYGYAAATSEDPRGYIVSASGKWDVDRHGADEFSVSVAAEGGPHLEVLVRFSLDELTEILRRIFAIME